MYCQFCGKENGEGASFCNACGKPLNGVVDSKTSAQESKRILRRKINVLGLISAVAVFLSAFVPYVSFSIMGSNKFSVGFMDEGFNLQAGIVLAIAFVAILSSLFGKNIPNIILGFLAFLLFWGNQLEMNKIYAEAMDANFAYGVIQKEAGYYLLLLGSIGLVLAGIVGIIQRKNN